MTRLFTILTWTYLIGRMTTTLLGQRRAVIVAGDATDDAIQRQRCSVTDAVWQLLLLLLLLCRAVFSRYSMQSDRIERRSHSIAAELECAAVLSWAVSRVDDRYDTAIISAPRSAALLRRCVFVANDDDACLRRVGHRSNPPTDNSCLNDDHRSPNCHRPNLHGLFVSRRSSDASF